MLFAVDVDVSGCGAADVKEESATGAGVVAATGGGDDFVSAAGVRVGAAGAGSVDAAPALGAGVVASGGLDSGEAVAADGLAALCEMKLEIQPRTVCERWPIRSTRVISKRTRARYKRP